MFWLELEPDMMASKGCWRDSICNTK